MSLLHELTPAISGVPAGWVLVEASLGAEGRHVGSSLVVYRRSLPRGEEIPLPVAAQGEISEVVRLPDDVVQLGWRLPRDEPSRATIAVRRIGWLGRTARMLNRVVRTYVRLTAELRKESGLTLWRSLRDLPRAYRIATSFRVRDPRLHYSAWVERFDTLGEQDTGAIRAQIGRLASRPQFHVLVAAYDTGPGAVRATLASLRAQLYRDFSCTVLDEGGARAAALDDDADSGDASGAAPRDVGEWLATLNAGLAGGQAEAWIMLLQAGDALAPHALYWFAREAEARPDAAILYADDDCRDAGGRRADPRFKPDWSPEHLRATHYIGAAAVLRGAQVAAAGGVTADCCRHGNYDLLLRVGAASPVAHVPAILLHRGTNESDRGAWENSDWCASAVRAELAGKGISAEVVPTFPACRRVRYRLPDAPPLATLIVPTRDAAALLRRCIESVLSKTTYPRFEILVVDNRSSDREALAYLGEIAARGSARVLRDDRPFNFSAINNLAAREARGEMLCLLNNDVEVIAPDWLEEMAGHLLQRQVGAVGAKLHYPDGRVQHAGMTVGPAGGALHLHRYLERGEPGYCDRAVVAQEISAVTGACLLTWKALYQRLGGLDERRLPVGFNDVDYCLRLQEAGYRVVFTPHAALTHHESATRGSDEPLAKRLRARREIDAMRRRWRERMALDPYYNPNLSYRRPDFSPGETPRVRKPWR